MKVAVIIVEFNNAEETIKYVNKISQYDTIQRIVVVDNYSTDEHVMPLLNKIQNEKVVVIQTNKNGGYGYGNNFGIHYLEEKQEIYDYIIISNSDIDIEKDAIDECLQILEKDQKTAIVAPRMFDSNNNPIRRSSWKIRTFCLDLVHSTRLLELIFYYKMRKGEYSKKEYEQDLLQVEAISGAFFIIKYDIFKEIGFFDDNIFLFYEEDILAKKIKEKNYQVCSLNKVKFIHYESQTIDRTFHYYNKMKQLYKSKMYYHKKYNNINFWQILLFKILHICRNIELIIEIPIRKLLRK